MIRTIRLSAMKPNETSNNINPTGLDRAEAQRVLKQLGAETSLSDRLAGVSKSFLGRPYVEGSLGGGPDLPEELRLSLEAFDCVTYIETALALSLARTIDEFIDAVRLIRYEDGTVDWVHRNHYMVDWACNNEERGFIVSLTGGPATVEKTCTLDLIAGLPAKAATFRYFPKQGSGECSELVETGDLIFFVSTRANLDVFHIGLLVKHEGDLLMRHATRTANAVIEQSLNEFMSRNEMAGFILLRPLCLR